MAWSYEFSAVKGAQGLVIQGRDFYEQAIARLGDGERVMGRLTTDVEKRSAQQNRMLWGPIYDQLIAGIAEDVGYDKHDHIDKENMHEGLLMLFGGTVVDPVTKREVAKERSSSMTTARFAEFVEWIVRYAADEHGIVVTLPGEL